MTDAERTFWGMVRNRQYKGLKFRRQVPIGPYIVDFLCESEALIVELDGDYHLLPEEYARDEIRTRFLESRGYRVLRIANLDVTRDHDWALAELDSALGQPCPPRQLRS